MEQNKNRKADISLAKKTGHFHLLRTPVTGGAPTLLIAGLWREVQRMIWVKDGRGLLAVAASTDAQETRQIWFIDYPGGQARRVTAEASIFDFGLSVSSDPNSFLLVQHRQTLNLWSAPADNFSKAKQITFAALSAATANFTLDWLPNNRIVYAATQGRGLNLWSMDIGYRLNAVQRFGRARLRDANPHRSYATQPV